AVEATLGTDAAIATARDEHEQAMRKAWAYRQDAAGARSALPPTSVLAPDDVHKAVILEVSKGWARVGIGAHEAMIPLAWTDWAYKPNPARSWRYTTQNDLTTSYDYEDEA